MSRGRRARILLHLHIQREKIVLRKTVHISNIKKLYMKLVSHWAPGKCFVPSTEFCIQHSRTGRSGQRVTRWECRAAKY